MQFHEVYDKELLTFFKSRRFQVPKSGLVTYISSYFQALAEMSKAFEDPSELLKHEVAYCIGQMGMPEAVKILEDVLMDVNQEPIVRHEAGEALGAIGR